MLFAALNTPGQIHTAESQRYALEDPEVVKVVKVVTHVELATHNFTQLQIEVVLFEAAQTTSSRSRVVVLYLKLLK